MSNQNEVARVKAYRAKHGTTLREAHDAVKNNRDLEAATPAGVTATEKYDPIAAIARRVRACVGAAPAGQDDARDAALEFAKAIAGPLATYTDRETDWPCCAGCHVPEVYRGPITPTEPAHKEGCIVVRAQAYLAAMSTAPASEPATAKCGNCNGEGWVDDGQFHRSPCGHCAATGTAPTKAEPVTATECAECLGLGATGSGLFDGEIARCTACQGTGNALKAGPRDWPEDFVHENGKYQNRCSTCLESFMGYKRRITCKLCADSAKAEPVTSEGGSVPAQAGSKADEKIANTLRDVKHAAEMIAESMHWLSAALAKKSGATEKGEPK